MGAGPARADEIGGAMDSEGLAINRENSGPKSGVSEPQHINSASMHEELKM